MPCCDKTMEHSEVSFDILFAGAAAEQKARAEKWKRLASDAMLVLRAHAIGNATQKRIEADIQEEVTP